jgi:hypothetical protein
MRNLDFASRVQFHFGTMRVSIKDEFTYLPISRQRKYQLRMQRDKKCTECGEPVLMGIVEPPPATRRANLMRP